MKEGDIIFYIKQANSKNEVSFFTFKKTFNRFAIKDNVIILPYLYYKEISEKKAKKVSNNIITYLSQDKVHNTIAISNDLQNVRNFITPFNTENIQILNGRELFSLLIPHILEYISKHSQVPLNELSISIASIYPDETLKELIYSISQESKTLNIVTQNSKALSSTIAKLYNDFGIILHTTTNKKKAFLKSQIIINYDLPNEVFNKFLLPSDAIILNIKNEIKVNKKSFLGININYYNISINNSILDTLKLSNLLYNFKLQILYESLIIEHRQL